MSSTSDAKPLAVITGASSGIGREYACRLADQGYDLFLVARDAGRLEQVRQEVEQCGAAAELMVADLSQPHDISAVAARIGELPRLDFLVNNAGFGTMGDFVDVDVQSHLAMVNVHVAATIQLTHSALTVMRRRGAQSSVQPTAGGSIVNVSSMSAFLIGPGQVTYAATKSLLVSFSESLQVELEETGIRLQALCPGFTRTGFHDRPAFERFDRSKVAPGMWMTPAQVVDASLAGLRGRKVVCVPGAKNRVLARLFGVRAVRKMVGKKVRKK